MAAVPISIERYLSTSWEPECEYVDGRVADTHVGEPDHSHLMGHMAMLLGEPGLRPYIMPTTQVRAPRFRVPDVLGLREKPSGRFLRTPPYDVVEVLSTEDRASEFEEKIDDYLDFGVDNVWVIDPRRQRMKVCTREGRRFCREISEPTDGAISIPLTEIFADMPSIGGE
ncbi:MAG TPA: Uma2 family endonuclease [Bryobacteraceae bacterium]|nr:Uma2 family endonuclease [Bryobacteraceae bacterium]